MKLFMAVRDTISESFVSKNEAFLRTKKVSQVCGSYYFFKQKDRIFYFCITAYTQNCFLLKKPKSQNELNQKCGVTLGQASSRRCGHIFHRFVESLFRLPTPTGYEVVDSLQVLICSASESKWGRLSSFILSLCFLFWTSILFSEVNL